MERYTTLIKRSSVNAIQLEKIKVGDLVEDEYGKAGKVANIEKVVRSQEAHYYFHLDKAGTILVIL